MFDLIHSEDRASKRVVSCKYTIPHGSHVGTVHFGLYTIRNRVLPEIPMASKLILSSNQVELKVFCMVTDATTKTDYADDLSFVPKGSVLSLVCPLPQFTWNFLGIRCHILIL